MISHVVALRFSRTALLAVAAVATCVVDAQDLRTSEQSRTTERQSELPEADIRNVQVTSGTTSATITLTAGTGIVPLIQVSGNAPAQDSDSSDNGELIFRFYVDGGNLRKLDGGRLQSWPTGEARNITEEIFVQNAPDRVVIQVEGYDDDIATDLTDFGPFGDDSTRSVAFNSSCP